MKRGVLRRGIARRLAVAVASLFVVALLGASGYHVLGHERWSWPDCFYMTIITLSTADFAETLEGLSTTPFARLWTALLILLGSGSLVF